MADNQLALQRLRAARQGKAKGRLQQQQAATKNWLVHTEGGQSVLMPPGTLNRKRKRMEEAIGQIRQHLSEVLSSVNQLKVDIDSLERRVDQLELSPDRPPGPPS